MLHLDAYYWHSGWRPTPDEEWREVVRGLVAGEAWVMDGNYSRTLDIRLPTADTIVFLDVARTVCAWRIVKRVLRQLGRDRPDMAEGCPERLDIEFFKFLKWIWDYPVRSRPTVLRALDRYRHKKRVLALRSRADTDRFMKEAALSRI